MAKKLLYFRIYLLVWIIVCNLILQFFQVTHGWVIFISNIMLFTLGGDIRKNFISVELGGLSGLLFAYFSILLISYITPVLGQIAAVMPPVSLVLFIIIVVGPFIPDVLNNTSFAYFTCAFICAETFFCSFVEIIVLYLLGSFLVNGVSIFLLEKTLY